MSRLDEIRSLLRECSAEERRIIFDELRKSLDFHRFEKVMNAKAEMILDALARASKLTILGVRGILAEAAFGVEVIPALANWRDITPEGNFSYDFALQDTHDTVRVQVKMQRRRTEKSTRELKPFIREGFADVEIQRTRGGQKNGKATRPYHFEEFDVLAVCMEPSHGRWNSFLFIPSRWLFPRRHDADLIEIHQPVSLQPDDVWTDNFDEAVRRLRSGNPRPPGVQFSSRISKAKKRPRKVRKIRKPK